LLNEYEKVAQEYENNEREIKDLLDNDFVLALNHKKYINSTITEMDNNLNMIHQHLDRVLNSENTNVENSQDKGESYTLEP
jgi:hypothetical protein